MKGHRKKQERVLFITDRAEREFRAGERKIAQHNKRAAERKPHSDRYVCGNGSLVFDRGQQQRKETCRNHDPRRKPRERGQQGLIDFF